MSSPLAFSARAVSDRAVLVLFAQPMLASAAIENPANFVLTDLAGTPVSVLSAEPNDSSNIIRVRLNLGAALVAGKPYALRINNAVVTVGNAPLDVKNANVVWHFSKPKVSVPISRFTGEVRTPIRNDRTASEVLMLQESLGILVEPSLSVGNVGVLLSDTFEESGSGSEVVSTGVTAVSGASISQNVRVRTKVQPFDSARPNYITSHEWSLREAVHIVHGDSVTGHKDHDFAGEEKLSVSEAVAADRARSLLANEALTLQESVTITPEPRKGLDDSTLQLFGTPNGQVFFSPALVPGTIGQSSISVDEVQVCTRAYDVYKPPAELDPAPLYTHGGGLVPSGSSVLSGGFVLFAKFERLTGAKTTISDKPADAPERPIDVGASIKLIQVYDPARFALLNSPGWTLFDNVGLPFVVADNLSPVGAPVEDPALYFANPSEDHTLVEALATSAALSVDVAESLTLIEETHQFPGMNQVVVAVSESLTLSDGVTPAP